MHSTMLYVANNGRKYVLGKGDAIITSGDLRDYEWGYSTQYDRIKSFVRELKSKTFSVSFRKNADKAADDFYEITEYDVNIQEPGKLYLTKYNNPEKISNCYYLEGYIIASKKDQFRNGSYVNSTFSFLTDGEWKKETTQHFNLVVSDSVGGKNLDYPHDFPYDFTTSLNIFQLINSNYIDTDFRLTIYGPVSNPSITIGGHEYEVLVDVDVNEYMVIDSVSKKIYKVSEYGEKTNCFNYRNRDSYIFQRIPAGTNYVSWGSDFRFDITLVEKRSEPKWT